MNYSWHSGLGLSTGRQMRKFLLENEGRSKDHLYSIFMPASHFVDFRGQDLYKYVPGIVV